MNPHRYSYSQLKAEIIFSVLSGTSIKEVALKYDKSPNWISSTVRLAAKRWKIDNNLNVDLNLNTIRENAIEINKFVSSHSIETEEQKNVRLADKKLKHLKVQLLSVQEQIKQKLDRERDLKNLVEAAEKELEHAKGIANAV